MKYTGLCMPFLFFALCVHAAPSSYKHHANVLRVLTGVAVVIKLVGDQYYIRQADLQKAQLIQQLKRLTEEKDQIFCNDVRVQLRYPEAVDNKSIKKIFKLLPFMKDGANTYSELEKKYQFTELLVDTKQSTYHHQQAEYTLENIEFTNEPSVFNEEIGQTLDLKMCCRMMSFLIINAFIRSVRAESKLDKVGSSYKIPWYDIAAELGFLNAYRDCDTQQYNAIKNSIESTQQDIKRIIPSTVSLARICATLYGAYGLYSVCQK